MIVLFVVIALIAAFYILVYCNWKYEDKFTFKTILIYIFLGITVIMIWVSVSTVIDVAEQEKDKMLAHRLSRAEDIALRGDYTWLADSMESDMDYEEEFEYLWERLMIYSSCNRYLVLDAAAKAGLGEQYGDKAQEYKKLLLETAGSPEYEKNASYGKAFLKKADLNGN